MEVEVRKWTHPQRYNQCEKTMMVMMMTMTVMVVMTMVIMVIIMMLIRRTSHLRMHVNPLSSHADYSDATQMQRVWDFACFPARKGTWITADRDQESQIFVHLKPIPSTGITSEEQSQFCTIAVVIWQKRQIVKIESLQHIVSTSLCYIALFSGW